MNFPARLTPARRWWRVPFVAGGLVLSVLAAAPGTRLHAEEPPRSAWLDLRPPPPGAAPQTVPAWVEAVEFLPVIPGEAATSAGATFRLRFQRPAGMDVDADDDAALLLRVFFREGTGETALPRVTAWDELGHRLLDSGPLGVGLPGALGSSEALTVPMRGVDYLEITAPDEAAVRGAQIQWLQRRQLLEPADAPTVTESEPERARELQIVAATGQPAGDAHRYGTVIAGLQPGIVSLVGGGANSQQPGGLLLDFELERVPLAALLTFEILSDAPVDAPPLIFLNGRAAGTVNLQLPDLNDPGYQGEAASMPIARNVIITAAGDSVPGPLAFRYTGWLRARALLPAAVLRPGVNRLLVQLSNDVAAGAVRAVDLQLKYPWEKLDYVVSPAINPPPFR